jgi:hypothetical protein
MQGVKPDDGRPCASNGRPGASVQTDADADALRVDNSATEVAARREG